MMNLELKRLIRLLNDMQDQNCHTPDVATDFDVVLLMCDLVTLLRYQIAKTISLEVQAAQPFRVCLAESKLRQALLNLLLNAVQALDNNTAGHICIQIYPCEFGLTIRVLDDGIGFPAEMLEDDSVVTGTAYHRDARSGLERVRRFMQQIGGSIKLSNRLEHGGCVTLLLPQKCIIATDNAAQNGDSLASLDTNITP